MDAFIVRCLADICTSNARIESMKAANAEQITTGANLAYTEKEFYSEAIFLEQISLSLRERYG